MSAARPAPPGARMWREVADQVFVRRYADFNVNVGLIVGAESALVVDTRGSGARAANCWARSAG